MTIPCITSDVQPVELPAATESAQFGSVELFKPDEPGAFKLLSTGPVRFAFGRKSSFNASDIWLSPNSPELSGLPIYIDANGLSLVAESIEDVTVHLVRVREASECCR